jgi:hypothetical protein
MERNTRSHGNPAGHHSSEVTMTVRLTCYRVLTIMLAEEY